MHKLIILIEPPANETAFDDLWPQFLHLAESMPGLRRETTGRVVSLLYGKFDCWLMHELYFDSLAAIQQAMGSEQGREAGALLQRMTGGRVTLLLTDHKEDELENIRKYREVRESERG